MQPPRAMDIKPSWTRPKLNPRTRRVAMIAGILSLGLFAGGLIAGRALTGDHVVFATPIVPPTIITVPAPAPSVTVRLPEPPPPPPPVVEPVVEPVPPRALAPRLWAECVLPSGDNHPDADRSTDADLRLCQWDRGFPAISGDGALIATEYVPDDGGRGYPGLTIRFIDPSTSRVVRSALILSPDEFVEDPEARGKLQARIARRVAVVQRTLDAGRFRALVSLGGSEDAADPAVTSSPRWQALHAEVSGGAVRIVDPSRSSVIWQGFFGVERPGGPAKDTDFCSGWGLHRMALWWDPATKTILSVQVYRTGGCMCSDDTFEEVRHVETP
jgi:hypothetical protein